MSVNSSAIVPTGGVEASVTAQAYARGRVRTETNQLREAFAAFTGDLPDRLVIAVSPGEDEDPLVLGDDRPFHAWSTIKVPVVAAVLSAVPGEVLTSRHHELAERAITESDNPAILELFDLLAQRAGGTAQAAAAIERLFRLGGDDRTEIALAAPPPGAITPFGQTGWSAADSAGFFSALGRGRLLNPIDTEYVLGLMQRIIPEQRWGLGSAELGRPVAFKAGWGPEPDGSCLVRQSGVVLGRDSPAAWAAISLVAEPPSGRNSFEVGVGMLTEAAGWIAGLIRPGP
jgi:beta-lactamase class A